jgi:hypothetical protein
MNERMINENNNRIEENNALLSNLLNVVNGLPNADDLRNVYSTEEKIVGTWINGKDIYRKTMVVNVAANTTGKVDLSAIDYETIWFNQAATFNVYGTSTVTTGAVTWYNGTDDYGLVYVQPTKLMNIKNSSKSDRVYYLTLEYTKVTE